MSVRVRFAPSPTGALHIGGVRTALFNYLFAKKHNGSFILRIEDTDRTRYVEAAEEYIINSLKWCGLEFDEGVGIGGDYAPYRQSERKEMYKKFAFKLVEEGNAYYAFDTPEELDKMRERLQAENSSHQQYGIQTRMSMKNSLSLSAEETEMRLDRGDDFVIRIKIPENETINVSDIVRGDLSFQSNIMDDKVLYKSDGMPTYHLANVVDDYLMKITHVIRGEEWLPSLPLHYLLYKFLGWEKSAPQFAHLPLILKPHGKGKLSKRDGEKGGFPVFPMNWNDADGNVLQGYKEAGYFPDAFINMLALLGWNPGTEQEIFSKEELVAAFDLSKVGKSGSRFDPEKTKWFNHQYLVNKDDEELAKLYIPILEAKGIKADLAYTTKIVSLIKERANFVSEFWEQSSFFFEAPSDYNAKMLKKAWKEDTKQHLLNYIDLLEGFDTMQSADVEQYTKQWLSGIDLGIGKLMSPMRLALVGEGKGPHLFDIMELIGKQETIKRVKALIENRG